MKRLIILLFVLVPALSWAQLDSIPVIGWFARNMSDVDPNYIQPSGYHLSVRLLNNYNQEEMRMNFDDGTKVTVRSPLTPSIGLGVSFDGLGYNYSVKLKKKQLATGTKKTEVSFSSSTQMFSISAHYRHTGGDFRLKKMVLPGLGDITHPDNDLAIKFTDDHDSYHNLNVGDECGIKMFDINLNYNWNHRKYSAPASTSFSNQQKRSAGSLITGVGVANYDVDNTFGDWQSEAVLLQAFSAYGKDAFRTMLTSLFTDPEARASYGQKKCSSIRFTDVQANIGYAYNWVPTPHLMLSAKLTLSPSLKICKGDNENNHFIRNTRLIAYGKGSEKLTAMKSLQNYMVEMYPTILKNAELSTDESKRLIDAITLLVNGTEIGGEHRTAYDDLRYSFRKNVFDVNYALHLSGVWNMDRWYAGTKFALQHYRYHSGLYCKFDNLFYNFNVTLGYRFFEKKKKTISPFSLDATD